MNPNQDQIEQVAQLCYAAQRELLLTRGLAALNQTVPPPWHLAPDSDKQAAREAVVRLWQLAAPRAAEPQFEAFEGHLAFAIVKAAVARAAGFARL